MVVASPGEPGAGARTAAPLVHGEGQRRESVWRGAGVVHLPLSGGRSLVVVSEEGEHGG